MQKDSRSRSKADYYTKHLFIRVMCHELKDDDDDAQEAITEAPRSESPVAMEEESISKEKVNGDAEELAGPTLTKSGRSTVRRRPLLPRTFADLPKRNEEANPSRLTQLLAKEGQVLLFQFSWTRGVLIALPSLAPIGQKQTKG